MTLLSRPIERVIGIDPGAHGALAFIDSRGRLTVHATAGDTCMRDAALDAIAGVDVASCICFIELVGGFIKGARLPGSAMFKMGKNAGYWEGLFAGLGVRVQLVRPQEWQAGIAGVGGQPEKAKRKRAIRDAAVRIFPGTKITLDVADAVMIAHYGRRVLVAGGEVAA